MVRTFNVGDVVVCVNNERLRASSVAGILIKGELYRIIDVLRGGVSGKYKVEDMHGVEIEGWAFFRERFEYPDDGCGLCISSCKRGERCEFFESMLEG